MKWIVCMLIGCLCAPAYAASISHIGANNPATEGWLVMSGVPGYAENDYWVTETYGYGRWGPSGTAWQAYFAGDWSATIECQWAAGPVIESRFTIFDGAHGRSTALTWDGSNAYYYQASIGDTPMTASVIDPSEWNTYDIHYRADDTEMDIYANDVLQATLDANTMNATNPGFYLMYWGDNNGGPYSKMHWREVTLRDHIPEVPEPGTLVLLLCAAIAFIAWRRRY